MPKIESSAGIPVGLVGDLLDLHANNGVVHVIDFVLGPENLYLEKPLP